MKRQCQLLPTKYYDNWIITHPYNILASILQNHAPKIAHGLLYNQKQNTLKLGLLKLASSVVPCFNNLQNKVIDIRLTIKIDNTHNTIGRI